MIVRSRLSVVLLSFAFPFIAAMTLFTWLLAPGQARGLTCQAPGDIYPTIQAAVDDATCTIINLASGTITETVNVSRSVTIQGQGAVGTVVNGNASGSVFTIQPGLVVTLTDMTIYNGNAGAVFNGGGIYNDGSTLILMSSTLTSNAAVFGPGPGGGYGGGLYNEGGAVTIVNSTLDSNSATTLGGGGIGGGIYNNFGEMSISGSVISANQAGDEGSGIYNNGGGIVIDGSTISGNTTTTSGLGGTIYNNGGEVSISNSIISDNILGNGGSGGGIYNMGMGTVTISTSSVISNSADSLGGAIFNLNSQLVIMSSTLGSNSAVSFGGGIFNNGGVVILNSSTINDNAAGYGGGIFNTTNGNIAIANSTLSGNTATDQGGGSFNNPDSAVAINSTTLNGNAASLGGGIFNFNIAGTVTLSNTIVANSLNGNDCMGPMTIQPGVPNLDSDTSCSVSLTADPLLGPLQDNGGNTTTHALLPGSPAIDTGICLPLLATDQRGAPRPANGSCDMGAYEAQLLIYLPFVVNNQAVSALRR